MSQRRYPRRPTGGAEKQKRLVRIRLGVDFPMWERTPLWKKIVVAGAGSTVSAAIGFVVAHWHDVSITVHHLLTLWA